MIIPNFSALHFWGVIYNLIKKSMSELIKLSAPQLIRDLSEGKTWFKREDAGWGSIQAKYGMNDNEVEAIRKDPRVRGKIPAVIRFILVDEDFDPTVNVAKFQKEETSVKTSIENGKPSFVETPSKVASVALGNPVPNFFNTL